MLLFKHNTATEIRISDGSSYVCSSDLHFGADLNPGELPAVVRPLLPAVLADAPLGQRIGARRHRHVVDRELQRAEQQRDRQQAPHQPELRDPRAPDRRELAVTDEAGEGRSEEHTSELQSLMRISYAVFCLKKKKANIYKKINIEPNYITAISQDQSQLQKH